MSAESPVLCEACKGVGVVLRPTWTEWHLRWAEWRRLWLAGTRRTDEAARVKWERENPTPELPEEVICGECGGVGAVPMNVCDACVQLRHERCPALNYFADCIQPAGAPARYQEPPRVEPPKPTGKPVYVPSWKVNPW